MKVYVPVTIEEYKGDLFVEVTAVVEVTPGEPMVRYYPDGSGYPGSLPDAELLEVVIDVAEDINCEPVEIDEEELYHYLDENYDLWIERALERAEDN